jgi:hypothetical protein
MNQESRCNFEFLNWEGRGYFGLPTLKGVAFPQDPRLAPWTSWMAAFEQAVRGDFRFVARLVELGGQVDGLVDRVTSTLLGDAAPNHVFSAIINRIEHDDNYELTYEWCDAVATRGRLGDIGTLLDAYEKNINDVDEDADIILIRVAQMLDPDGAPRLSHHENFGGFPQYRLEVEQRQKRLLDYYGSEDVYLWRGELTSVKRMAEMLLRLEPRSFLPSTVRRRFEASTGIDCSAMFDAKRRFRPLEAAAIAEDFLRSEAAYRYSEGERYFFGHPVP